MPLTDDEIDEEFTREFHEDGVTGGIVSSILPAPGLSTQSQSSFFVFANLTFPTHCYYQQ